MNVFAALTGKILGFVGVTLVMSVIVAVTVVEEVHVVVSILLLVVCGVSLDGPLGGLMSEV